jgi:hypothetical protein
MSPQAVIKSSLRAKTITFLASTSSLRGTDSSICSAELEVRLGAGRGAGGGGDGVTSVCGEMRGILILNPFFSQFKRPAFFLGLTVECFIVLAKNKDLKGGKGEENMKGIDEK